MRKFNYKEFLWFVLFICFTLYLYNLLSTGKINMFLAPRMHGYAWISLISFCLLSMHKFMRIFTFPNRKSLEKSFILLLTTLITGVNALSMAFDTSVVTNKGIISNGRIVSQGVNNTDSKKQIDYDKRESIEIQDYNYLRELDMIWNNLDKYKGKTIIISGFVYKEDNFSEKEFAVARMLMTCCAADAQIIGFMANWANANELEKDQWVRVYGTIDSTKYKKDGKNESAYPLIKVDKLEKINKPENIYINP